MEILKTMNGKSDSGMTIKKEETDESSELLCLGESSERSEELTNSNIYIERFQMFEISYKYLLWIIL